MQVQASLSLKRRRDETYGMKYNWSPPPPPLQKLEGVQYKRQTKRDTR